MTGTSWVIAISVGVIALAFVFLVISLVMTLISLKKTIETTNVICRDLEDKIHAFDPYMRMISGFGESIEKRAESFRDYSEEMFEKTHRQKKEKAANITNTSVQIAEWALLGLALWRRLKR